MLSSKISSSLLIVVAILLLSANTAHAAQLSVSITSASLTLEVGQATLVTAAASGGTGALHYQWKVNRSDVGSGSPTYLFRANATTLSNYTVLAIVTDSALIPSSASNATTITIRPAPSIVVSPSSPITMEAGQSISIGADPGSTGTGPFTYAWSVASGICPGFTSASGSSFIYLPTGVDSGCVFKVSAYDNLGFYAPTATSAPITIRDTTPPSLSPQSDLIKEATGPSGAVAAYQVTATDLVDGTVAVNCNPVSGSTFAVGTTRVVCTATDAHGNTGTRDFDVIVQDTTPPSLSPQSNITLGAIGPSGAVATYQITATDLVDGTDNVICAPSSGTTFAIGTTTVTCYATDAHNNTATPIIFKVSVLDKTPPSISKAPNVTIEATSPSGAVATYSLTATDIVDGTDPVTCRPASGSMFQIGITTVICNATDAHGNAATPAAFKVTVQDKTPPKISGASNITLQAIGPSGAIALYNVTATDIVDGWVAVTCNPSSGSTFGIGVNAVTCTAIDSAKNSASATFQVTVYPKTTIPLEQLLATGIAMATAIAIGITYSKASRTRRR